MTAPLRGLAGGAVRRALAGLALIVALAPGLTAAAGHLAPGDSAPVSAGPVLVRTTPGYDAEVVAEIGSGTLVTVADGPVAAPDGSLWYLTDSGGYVPAGALGESALAPDPELAD
ncbi:MAG: hypothetical protein H0U10_04580 [Chloroflexia bacterium]|nr:hypothetical protein [Chloroflexia bacterium]